jgi:hypothetical protein
VFFQAFKLYASFTMVDRHVLYEIAVHGSKVLLQSVTLHTDLGDIKIEVFCDQVAKASENFLALCASGYYDGNIIHR